MAKKIALLLVAMLFAIGIQSVSAEEGTAVCYTQEQLKTALEDETVHTVTLANSIEVIGYTHVEVSRPVTVDMGPYGISFNGQFSWISVFGPVLFTGDGDGVPLFTIGYRQFLTLNGGAVEATADNAVALYLTSAGKLTKYPMSIRANGENSVAVKSEGDISICLAAIEASGQGGIGVQADGTIDATLSEITAGDQALAGSDVFIYSSLVTSGGLIHDSLPLSAAISDTDGINWYFDIDEAIDLPDSVYLQFTGGFETLHYDFSLDILWDALEIDGIGPYEALGYIDGLFDRFGVENLNPISQKIHVYDREELYLFVDDSMPFYDGDRGRLSLRCLTGDNIGGAVTAWISQDDGETFAPVALLFPEDIHEGPDFFVKIVELFLDPDMVYQIYIQVETGDGVLESNILFLSSDYNEWIIAFGGDRNGTARNPGTELPGREELVPSLPEDGEEQKKNPPKPKPVRWTNKVKNEEKSSEPDDFKAGTEITDAPELDEEPTTEAPGDEVADRTPEEEAKGNNRPHSPAAVLPPYAVAEEAPLPPELRSIAPGETADQVDSVQAPTLPEVSQNKAMPQSAGTEEIGIHVPGSEDADSSGPIAASLSAVAFVSAAVGSTTVKRFRCRRK